MGLAQNNNSVKKSPMLIGLSSGIWAGFTVGLFESVAVVCSFGKLDEQTLLYWGPVAYGILGAVMGAGIGCAVAVFAAFTSRTFRSASLWASCFVAAFIPLALVIARFRIVRDLLHERAFSMAENLALVAAFAVLAVIVYLVLRRIFQTAAGRVVLCGYGAPALWIVVPLIGFCYNWLNTSFDEKPSGTLKASSLRPTPNVILIMADALRADHLPIYGYRNNRTPALDGFADDAIVFTNLTGQSSWTKPQSATLLTSLYPATHNTYLKPHVLPDDITTLAEVMRDMGYHTGGIVSNINLSPVYNFQQGFEYYCYLAPDYFFSAGESSSKLCLYNLLRLLRERFFSRKKFVEHYYQPAAVVNRKVFEWLSQAKDKPFFLFMHYMDSHDPYFEHPYNGTGFARVSNPNPPPEAAQRMRALYDQEITYVDEHFGKFIGFLKANGLYDDSLIIFTADHGEEFYDHGGWWHGTTLYQHQIHIPLIMKLPGEQQAGTRDTRIVRSVDIAPTIINAAGGALPPAMQGAPLLGGENDAPALDAYSEEDHEHNRIKSLRSGSWKLVMTDAGSPRLREAVELFDLAADPGEQHNLAGAHPDVVQQLTQKINSFAEQTRQQAFQATQGKVDQTTRDRLKALGYVQ